MSITLIGTGVFGVTDTGTDASAQSLTTNESCEEITLKNNNGDYKAVALIGKMVEKTYEVACTSGDEPPAIGANFLEGTVTARTKTASNSAFSTWSITVKKWGALSPVTPTP